MSDLRAYLVSDVSVALVADTDRHGGLLDRIDDETRKSESNRERRRSHAGF